MFDIDTINQMKKEERGQMRQIKNAILSKKISPAKKQQQWSAVCFPAMCTGEIINSPIY